MVNTPGGWANSRAYPLLVSRTTQKAVYKLMVDRDWSQGKALNYVIEEGLMSLNYLARPAKPLTPEEWKIQDIATIRMNWHDCSPKAQRYHLTKYPELAGLPLKPMDPTQNNASSQPATIPAQTNRSS